MDFQLPKYRYSIPNFTPVSNREEIIQDSVSYCNLKFLLNSSTHFIDFKDPLILCLIAEIIFCDSFGPSDFCDEILVICCYRQLNVSYYIQSINLINPADAEHESCSLCKNCS